METNLIISNFENSNAKQLGLILVDDFNQPFYALAQLLTKKRSNSENCFAIFPHEWAKRSKQILSHIESYNSNLTNVYARKCQIREIPLKLLRQFCDMYHIQGANRLALAGWGIYFGDDLLGVLSLGRHHRQNHDSNEVVLDRLCFKSGVRVVGGASKLFVIAIKWAMEQGFSKIISFSDNRWSLGGIYETLGFKFETNLAPDYFYLEKDDYTKKYSKQSQQKSNTNCPSNMTEKQWARLRNLIQVYDAGKKRWSFPIKREFTYKKNSYSYTRNGYLATKKGGIIYYASRYELRAAVLLDEMDEVKSFKVQHEFYIQGRKRFLDFLVQKTDGSFFILEVKPIRNVEKCKLQIEDNKKFASQNNWGFRLWTESEMGFTSEHYIRVWADKYLSNLTGLDFVKERQDRSCDRSKKYYQEHIKDNKITFYCEYCKEEHTQLELTYKNNVENNGRFICIKENGYIQGSRPKNHLKNPYESEGKKKCSNVECGEILPLEDFSISNKATGKRCGQCKKCRAKAGTAKYQAAKGDEIRTMGPKKKTNPYAAEGKKKCNNVECGEILSLESFSFDKSKYDGLNGWCKVCVKANRKK